MTFVVRMAWREVRASWQRLVFFFICVALGVGAIVALRSVIQTVRETLVRDARTLIASDVLVQTNRVLEADVRQRLDTVLRQHGIQARTDAVETATMVRPADPGKAVARMVELQGVQAAWPLYGTVTLQGGQPYSHALLENRGVLVRPELLAQLGVELGEPLIIGESTFTIRGVVLSEPGRRQGFFSFGPRVLIDLTDLQNTGLLQFGSRARYLTMLQVAPREIEPLVRAVRTQFRDQFVTARSYQGTEDQIGQQLGRAEDYLSLVGLIIVVLGGIGVWSVTRVFVRQKMKSIAVLKCVGATTSQVLAVYVSQVVVLGLAGSGLGVMLAAIGLQFVPESAAAALGASRPTLTPSATAQGVLVGVLVSLLFSLVPLQDVRRVRPLLLLRGEDLTSSLPGAQRRPWRERLAQAHWAKIATTVVVASLLIAVVSWQAGSWRVGAVVSAGFVLVLLALSVAAAVLVRAVRPLGRVHWFPLRHAVISMTRPGNQTRVILLAVGLGAFFMVGVRAVQSNLLREFSIDLRPGGPDMFLIDIQPDQLDAVRGVIARSRGGGRQAERFIPVLRARVTGVKGRTTRLDTVEDVRGQGSLAREYVITYRPALEQNETVIAGRFWPPSPSADAEVSIEEGIRERFGIDVGDRIRFDVLGRVIEATVTSVRRVEWSDARAGGFIFVFRPGVLDAAPASYIAIFRGPVDATARARLQRDLVAAAPNVSAIDVREITRSVQGVLANVTLAITIVGAVALISGVLILAGSVAMTKFQRLHEAAVFKTLGASTRTIAAMLAMEYAALGVLAGVVGSVAALASSWAVCRWLLDIAWRAPAPVVGLGIAITTSLVGFMGVAASVDVLRRKPLATLRAE